MKPLDDILAELQVEYLASLPKRADIIAEALDKKDYKTVITEFHKLKGTGKTYGLDHVTDIAEVCEKIYESDYQNKDAAELALHLILNESGKNPPDKKKLYQLNKILKKCG